MSKDLTKEMIILLELNDLKLIKFHHTFRIVEVEMKRFRILLVSDLVT